MLTSIRPWMRFGFVAAVFSMGSARVSRAAGFTEGLALVNRLEVTLGQMAVIHAKRPAVRYFAQEMIRDHVVLQERLAAVAQAGISLPLGVGGAGLPPEAQVFLRQAAALPALQVLSGPSFDAAYLQFTAEGNAALINLGQRAYASAPPAARVPLAFLLFLLQDHYFKALQLQNVYF